MDPILANSGSALMWGTTTHLVIGNLFIGIFEGLLVAKIFNTPRRKSVPIITFGNYASAWLGMMILGFTTSQLDLTIENAKVFLISATMVAFVITILIELPFFFWVTTDSFPSRKRFWKSLTFVHLASYLVFILPWYLLLSDLSFLKLRVVEQKEIDSEPYLIAFLSPDRTSTILFDLSTHKVVESIPSENTFLRYGDYDCFAEDKKIIQPIGIEPEKFDEFWDLPIDKNWSKIHQLKKDETFKIKLEGIFHWNNGLVVQSMPNNPPKTYKMAAPWISWSISRVTQIKDGLVLFQLGPDQICLADFRKMTIALLARGSRPVVVTKATAP